MKIQRTKLRDLRSNMIGHLVNVKSIVVKVTDQQPLLAMASYICESCQNEVLVKVNQDDFQPPQLCQSNTCVTNKVKGNLIQNFAMSKFVPIQKVKIQELSDETMIGSIPRVYNVFLKGTNVGSCSPGDLINLTGIFLNQRPEAYMARVKDNLL